MHDSSVLKKGSHITKDNNRNYRRVNSNREHPPPGQTLGICIPMSPGGRAFDS